MQLNVLKNNLKLALVNLKLIPILISKDSEQSLFKT